VGGVAEIVTPDTGIVVRAGDAHAVSQALVRLAADGGLRRRMGEAARTHVRARYSADRLVRDVTSLYDELRAR
jgi:glycosyltransferase involved in cell wall biosynthesis